MNVKTLNTTSLDGDVVIIKKGGASGGGTTPPSGGSGEGGSNIEYLDVRGINFTGGGAKEGNLMALCYSMNGTHDMLGDFVLPIGQVYVAQTSELSLIRYIAVDFSSKLIMNGEKYTLDAALELSGWTQEELDAIPRITEEQFYTFE